MSFFRRHKKLSIFAGTFIGIPAVSLAGLGAYVQYRVATKPAEHTFQPLVDDEGRLLLEDCVIPAPTNWQLFKRIVNLIAIFTPIMMLYVYVWWDEEKNFHWWLVKLRDAVELAGPAFVKAGQWSCTRNDLFSPQFRDVFQELFCEARTHPYEETVEIIEADFKKPMTEIFESMDPMPIGSGSIGQVHSAVLKNGQRVAVKVMHPNVVESIAKDFFVINNIAKWVHKYATSLEHYDIETLALAWTNHLAAQLDFRIEKEHLVLFRSHFQGTDYVTFPEPFDATQRVLIEEFCVGESATQEFLKRQEPHVRDILAAKGLNCFCKMLMRDNFLHGDLHPGNILVDTRDPHDPKVVLIDVGLCQKMTNDESKLNHDLMGSFVRWDSKLCADTLFAMGAKQKFANKEQYDEDMKVLFKKFRPVGAEPEVITNVLQACFDVLRTNRVTMDPAFVNTMWATLILESFITALNEDFNMVQHSSAWLVSEGHLSGSLLKNILKSGRDVAIREFKKTKSKYGFGAAATLEDQETYVPKHKERLALKLRQQQLEDLEAKNKAALPSA